MTTVVRRRDGLAAAQRALERPTEICSKGGATDEGSPESCRSGSYQRCGESRTPGRTPYRSSHLSGRLSDLSSREALQFSAISGVSTAATDPLRIASPKQWVPSVHLRSDNFPQFPSARQVPTSSGLLPESEAIENGGKPAEAATLYDVGVSILLLIRAILLQYRCLWLTLAAVVYCSPWLFCVSKALMIFAVLFSLSTYMWSSAKWLFLSAIPLVPSQIAQTHPLSSPPQCRLRDLPEHQPEEPLKGPLQTASSNAEIPPWLRCSPIGRFGEVDLPTESWQPVVPKFSDKTVKRISDLDQNVTTQMMCQKLKVFTSELCNRLVMTEAQDITLASAFSQLGLRYVVEHPLAAFYSLSLNDNSVVNLNDRHLPLTLITLCNSFQQNERQIGAQLVECLVQRRQLEKLLVLPGAQRLPLLRRLAKWSCGGGLEKEYSPYNIGVSNGYLTDGDILHLLLFTWLSQQLPSLKTDVFSRTHLSAQANPVVQGYRTSLPVITIQKLPTEMPSPAGTFYKITELSSTKSKVIEIAWHELGVIEGIACFLVLLKSSRPDIVSQAGPEVAPLFEN